MPLTGRPAYLADVKHHAEQLEREWMRKVPEDPGTRLLYAPWMPFNIPAFMDLLFEAFSEAPGNRFLGIGCGIGTKEMLAREFYSLDVFGIERVPEYVEQARKLDVDVDEADADGWYNYGAFDLVWFNRVFRDPGRQQHLEDLVWRDMAPGAVVMIAHLEHPPPQNWILILDDLERRRGIWMKPPVSG
jgi:SAM-dependent methyltransferase